MIIVDGLKRSTIDLTNGLIGGLVNKIGISPIIACRSNVWRTAEINSCKRLGAMDNCFSSPAPT